MTPYQKLEELYATLPTVQCKKLCQDCCGPILIPKIEAKRLEEKRGWLESTSTFEPARRIYLPEPEIIKNEFIGLKPDEAMNCVFLAPILGSCMAYKIRPLVCRCWGVVDDPLLKCPFGCIPSRWMSREEFKSANLKVVEIQREAERTLARPAGI